MPNSSAHARRRAIRQKVKDDERHRKDRRVDPKRRKWHRAQLANERRIHERDQRVGGKTRQRGDSKIEDRAIVRTDNGRFYAANQG